MDATKIPTNVGPIGIFDSGYGGLTILEQVRKGLPRYDYLYLGDNAFEECSRVVLEGELLEVGMICRFA